MFITSEKINTRTHEPPFYFDVKLLARQWNCYGNTKEYHHTLSPPLLWALRCCLMEICKETLPKTWARHATTTEYFLKKLKDYGFELFIPKAEDRLVTVTTVLLPKRCTSADFVKYVREKHDIAIFGGLGPTTNKVLRVGIMGVNSNVAIATRVADAMADTARAVLKSSL